jgi:hypothetical protein
VNRELEEQVDQLTRELALSRHELSRKENENLIRAEKRALSMRMKSVEMTEKTHRNARRKLTQFVEEQLNEAINPLGEKNTEKGPERKKKKF